MSIGNRTVTSFVHFSRPPVRRWENVVYYLNIYSHRKQSEEIDFEYSY